MTTALARMNDVDPALHMDAFLYKLQHWGIGPWLAEPDRLEFRHKGVPCLLNRGPLGAWCGYAACEPGHPWHGKHYSGQYNYETEEYEEQPIPAEVHWGLTYADACQGDICHVPAPGEPDDVWWLGFDCAHCDDLTPSMRQYSVRSMAKRLLPTVVLAMLADLPEREEFGTYRDLAYVRAETEGLAEQIIAARSV